MNERLENVMKNISSQMSFEEIEKYQEGKRELLIMFKSYKLKGRKLTRLYFFIINLLKIY